MNCIVTFFQTTLRLIFKYKDSQINYIQPTVGFFYRLTIFFEILEISLTVKTLPFFFNFTEEG